MNKLESRHPGTKKERHRVVNGLAGGMLRGMLADMDEREDSNGPAAEAAAWFAKLRLRSITADDLKAFWEWRRDPDNRRAFEAHEAQGQRQPARYVVRPEAASWSVIDIWTGEAAVIAMTPQKGISEEDAHHTAELLNRRAAGGDRSILQ